MNDEEKRKANRKAVQRYLRTEKGKVAQRRYRQSKKGKFTIKRFQQTDKMKTAQRKYYLKYPERRKARSAVDWAIRSGKLPRPDSLQCHYCNCLAKEYHHYKGYKPEYWLDVVPVCMKCHTQYFSRKSA